MACTLQSPLTLTHRPSWLLESKAWCVKLRVWNRLITLDHIYLIGANSIRFLSDGGGKKASHSSLFPLNCMRVGGTLHLFFTAYNITMKCVKQPHLTHWKLLHAWKCNVSPAVSTVYRPPLMRADCRSEFMTPPYHRCGQTPDCLIKKGREGEGGKKNLRIEYIPHRSLENILSVVCVCVCVSRLSDSL